ncbi:hypothetical protein [Halorarum halobium]|uniref:hypothetical protein n=1 Tax=Halorarum halobium TaxID=3075121 RepID=UPI003CCCBFD1
MNQRIPIGTALMVVGTLLLLPAATPGTAPVPNVALVPAAALLTYGTYLVGTSEGGRPV